ncbi:MULTISPECIES: helix-turn-helix transcriptional regulator [unclassified Thauera]|uniref:helix-turn-helix transcriptional regulator n=1 Tax=unclassified Thauera TaxID=2609274 RepID=UPI0002CECADF|nr:MULTISPECIES: helix-turn-helix transcriptional regulator [unclassified Thauera]ENO80723.1 excisionase family DNA binding domain-containing protein [Thauera sp. 27]ENO92032.1 excisionase family DNA binding domain-containing protein [Thauera sp. 28]WBL64865.1 helix-turn-helix transcriptional regulator [Thauera sp. WB-2]HAG74798.1 helix-turn-helix domain-containing protein [Thauera sp.]HAY11054.1 helix-turn-helix domain-containing protein [Thauera sp.]
MADRDKRVTDPALTQRAPQDVALPAACLTAREAASFLQLNEKKLYELANSREIPAARIGGKWLFPRALLEEWLLEQAHGGALTDRLLITGSDDPLLAATTAALAAQLGAEGLVAYSPTGTLTGLELLARRRANVCALHWGGVEHSAQQHALLLRRFGASRGWTLVRLALREQGVILRRGLEVDGLETLVAFDYRWAMRQTGAGSRHFLESALASRGFSAADCSVVAEARSEREAAAVVAREDADCAPGTRAAAAEFGLGFLPLGWEAFDLALPRDILFRRLFQDLLSAYGNARAQSLSLRLSGYDLSPLGRVLTLD